MKEILDSEEEGPSKPPKMPPGYRVQDLRAPRLKKNGKALPRRAVENLDALLCASRLHKRCKALDDVCAACDARSLAEHAWDLAYAWDLDGKRGQIWMLHAVAHLGDDEVVRRLTPALKGRGIADMLGHIGTDAALMELVTIRVRVGEGENTPRYSWGTREAIDRIAARRGLDVEDLEDRFTPTCNVDDDGGIDLDLGPRKVRLTFDAQLTRILLDDKGQKLPRFAPAKTDDEKKVAIATALLADLDEDIQSIADARIRALRSAMMVGRTWTRGAFQTMWLDHPLLVHMARGVLWEARKADGARMFRFRVAEDGSFADVTDDVIELAGDVCIGVAHPLRLGSERARWNTMFADYKLLQPFEQLATVAMKLGATSAKRAVRTKTLTTRMRKAGWVGDYNMYVMIFEDGVYGEIAGRSEVTVCAVRGRTKLERSEWDEVIETELARGMQIALAEE